MWSLLTEISYEPLQRIAGILEDVRVIAWDHGRRSARVSNPRPQVKKAAKRNALRTASRLASSHIQRMSGRLLQDLEDAMVEEGLTASIFLRPVKPDGVPGAASGVFVLIEVTALEEIFIAAPLVFNLLRLRTPKFTELTVIPLHAEGHLIRFGLGGFETPFPMVGGKAFEQVSEILRAQKIPQAPLPVHDLTTEAISTAVAIGNFVRAERGGQKHPKSEGETLQKLEAQLGILSAQLRESLGELSDLVEPTLEEAKRSGLGAGDLQSLISGEADAGGNSRQRTALVFGAVVIDLRLELTEDDLANSTE